MCLIIDRAEREVNVWRTISAKFASHSGDSTENVIDAPPHCEFRRFHKNTYHINKLDQSTPLLHWVEPLSWIVCNRRTSPLHYETLSQQCPGDA